MHVVWNRVPSRDSAWAKFIIVSGLLAVFYDRLRDKNNQKPKEKDEEDKRLVEHSSDIEAGVEEEECKDGEVTWQDLAQYQPAHFDTIE